MRCLPNFWPVLDLHYMHLRNPSHNTNTNHILVISSPPRRSYPKPISNHTINSEMPGQSRPRTDEWYEVPPRRGRGENRQEFAKKKETLTKFFVSNLPTKCSSKDLEEVFKIYGDVEGTYIARKLDRLGKRFGFVSFRNVREVRRLEREMSDVWIGSYKLFVVMARFIDGKKVDTSNNGFKEKTKEMLSQTRSYV